MQRAAQSAAMLWVGLIVGTICFAVASGRLYLTERQAASEDMRVAMPLFVQLSLAMGDRYLASNLATMRALTSPTEGMSADQYRVQAHVQEDASLFNPYQQDNYYIGGATLPWNGQVDAAQRILERASNARTFDLWPPYQYGFNEWYIKKNVVVGARWALLAASRSADLRTKVSMQAMAARWMANHDDPELALALVKGLAADSNERVFKRYLAPRIQRLEGLVALRRGAELFARDNGRPPRDISELLASKTVAVMPHDPMGIGYALDAAGVPQFANRTKAPRPRP